MQALDLNGCGKVDCIAARSRHSIAFSWPRHHSAALLVSRSKCRSHKVPQGEKMKEVSVPFSDAPPRPEVDALLPLAMRSERSSASSELLVDDSTVDLDADKW